MQKKSAVQRCNSGIPNFDKISHGGFVRNTANTIVGGPGAGKTTFLLEFLYKGVTDYNEKGLFISLEPDLSDLMEDALALGWDFKKLEKEGKCFFIKLPPSALTQEFQLDILNLIKKNSLKRVCFDPASLFASFEKNEVKVRTDLYELISMFKKVGVTLLLSEEADIANETSHFSDMRFEYLKFLTDGVIELYSSGLGGVSDRAIRIVKMRRTSHERGPIPFEINDKGVNVILGKQ